jgi:hypothetical protein
LGCDRPRQLVEVGGHEPEHQSRAAADADTATRAGPLVEVPPELQTDESRPVIASGGSPAKTLSPSSGLAGTSESRHSKSSP